MILKLPEELVIYILGFIDDVHDIYRVGTTCKQLRRISFEDAIWHRFFQRRYFSSSIDEKTLEQCPEKSWRYLYFHKSVIENRRWQHALSPAESSSTNRPTVTRGLSVSVLPRKNTVVSDDEQDEEIADNTEDEDVIDPKTNTSRSLSFPWYSRRKKRSATEEDIHHSHTTEKESKVLVRNRVLEVTCMRFDRRNIVTGGGFADVWDFDPGSLLAPKTVQVYDVRSGRKAKTLSGHGDSITCLKILKDRIISGSKDHTIKIWQRQGHKWSKRIPYQVDTLQEHKKSITALDAEDNLLVSTSKEKSIRFWDLETKECKYNIDSPSIIYALQLRNDKLVTGGKDRKLHLWDVETCRHVQTMKGHKGWISCLQIRFENLVLSGGGDGTVRMFDLRTAENVRSWKITSSLFSVGWITCLQWDENKVITGTADRAIKITDIVNGQCINTIKGHQDAITSLQYDHSKLLTASLDRTVRMWDFSGSASADSSPLASPTSSSCVAM